MAILELTMDAGRLIWAHRLHIQNTYSGLLFGQPDVGMNDRLIAELPRTAARLFGNSPVHIIEPSRSKKGPVDPSGYGPLESLPGCLLFADFTSSPCRHLQGSSLTLIWFQEAPFPVPSEARLKQLQGIAWESIARDFEY